jgi:hypothetical protein
MSTFSDVLIRHIRDVKRASIAIDAGRLAVVIANLTFLHDSVVATEQLLKEAAESTDLLPRSPFHDRLSKYYRSHLDEERDHVKWLRDDLNSAGVSVGEADRLAMAMVGTQYYLLKHAHPVALLGYMAVVEGDPVPVDVVELLERAHGKDLLRFVRIHALTDLEHRKELFEIINQSPEPLYDLIARSADNTLDYYVQAAATWGLDKTSIPRFINLGEELVGHFHSLDRHDTI